MNSINFNGRANRLKQLLLDGKKKEVAKQEDTPTAAENKGGNDVKPEAKPITASVAEIVATYNLSDIKLKPIVLDSKRLVVDFNNPVVPNNDAVEQYEPEVDAEEPEVINTRATSADASEDTNVTKYTTDQLKGEGFTEKQIEEYFDKNDNGNYVMKSDITFKKSKPDGGYETVEIKSLDELKEYCGADSRQKLKDEGIPDEVIDKYFDFTTNLTTGKSGYGLKIKYSSYNIGKTDNGYTFVNFNWRNEAKTDTIKVSPNGNYSMNEMAFYQQNDIKASRYIDGGSKAISDDTRMLYFDLELLGFTDELIEKYFEQGTTDKNSIESQFYHLKKDIEDPSGSGEVITSIDQLVKKLQSMGVIE